MGGVFSNNVGVGGAAFVNASLRGGSGDATDFTTAAVGGTALEGAAVAVNQNILTIAMVNAATAQKYQVGDFLEINVTDLNAGGTTVQTFTDSVVVVNVDPNTVGSRFEIAVTNARAPGSGLNAGSFLDASFAAAGSDTISIKRLAQTLIVDSLGAKATTSSDTSKTFDFRNPQNAVEFRNTVRVGVVLNPSSDNDATSPTLGTVNVSFTESDPIAAAAQIQASIENQLGGEYRVGGDLHIDVKAVAEVRKAVAANNNIAGATLIGHTVELSDTLFTDSRTRFGPTGTMGALASNNELSDEVADIQNVRFQFTTTKTAGVNETPQIRILSDVLAGYSSATKLFENLTIATGEHGNDKFIVTVDGEEVEADLDAGGALTSANAIVNTIVAAEETARDTANSEAAMDLARIGFNVDASGLVTASTSAARSISQNTAIAANNLTYAIDEGAKGGYFDPEALRILIQNGINTATSYASDVNVAYDSSTRTFTTTTASRGNTSSLKVGKSFGAGQTSTLMPGITDLVNTTGFSR